MKSMMDFDKKGMLILRYIRTFEILNAVTSVVYKLDLPPSISGVHRVSHVSMLKNYHDDGDYIIFWESELFNKELSNEE